VIGLKLPVRKRARDEAEKPFWISFADLMTALMVLFLVSVTVALFAVTQKPDEEAKKQVQRKLEINELLIRIAKVTKEYPSISMIGDTIYLAKFETNSSKLNGNQATMLRDFVPKMLTVVRDPLGDEWLKQIIVEGFADKQGSYIYNLDLSLSRAERVLCVLLAPPKLASNAMNEDDRKKTRELFLVGGSSFNALKENDAESRRIELKLEFLDLKSGKKEERPAPRDVPLDEKPCPLDLR
jgi:outer membrane protein OmpA-like peptidoglycan-associated protein